MLDELAKFIVAENGRIDGKKSFQKLVYFAQALGLPLNYSYRLHLYGPYSDSVAQELEKLVSEGVIRVSPLNQRSYELVQPSRDGHLDIGYKDLLEVFAERFCKMTPMQLELHSTVHFVWRNRKAFSLPDDKEDVISEVALAKHPKFDMPTIEAAYEKLVNWGMIA